MWAYFTIISVSRRYKHNIKKREFRANLNWNVTLNTNNIYLGVYDNIFEVGAIIDLTNHTVVFGEGLVF